MRAERPLLIVGGILCLLVLAAALFGPRAVLTGWLAAAVAAGSVPAGALGLLMAMRLVPGAWGETMRLTAEATALTLFGAALAFLPVVAGLWLIYPWAGTLFPGFKGNVLSPVTFVLATIARFAVLIGISRALQARRRASTPAAVGLIAFALVEYAVAVEWLMSLTPDFASASFGLQFVVRELVIAWSAMLLMRLSIGRPLKRIGVLGGVLLALLVAWGYLTFMAFLVSWSSNLPEGAGWYGARSGGWDSAELAFSLFAAGPALALMASPIRRSPVALRCLAALTLAGQLIELAWTALPGTGAAGVLAYSAALAGFGCLTTALLLRALNRRVHERTP